MAHGLLIARQQSSNGARLRMTTPLSMPTITLPDPAATALAGKQATDASSATGRSDFASVLNETAANHPSNKEISAETEDPGKRQQEVAAEQVDTTDKVQDAETDQCACPEQDPMPAAQAATMSPEGGNGLPPWLDALLQQPAPSERSIEATAGLFPSTSEERVDGQTMPTNPVAPATVENLSATHSGVRESAKAPAITVATDPR